MDEQPEPVGVRVFVVAKFVMVSTETGADGRVGEIATAGAGLPLVYVGRTGVTPGPLANVSAAVQSDPPAPLPGTAQGSPPPADGPEPRAFHFVTAGGEALVAGEGGGALRFVLRL